MHTEENKKILARNIIRYRDAKGVTNQQLCGDLGFKYTTYLDWIKAVTYPRIGKIEAMADYFGILKSDLIEEKTEEREEMQKNNDTLSNIIVRLRTDEAFLEAVEALYTLPPEKLSGLSALLK